MADWTMLVGWHKCDWEERHMNADDVEPDFCGLLVGSVSLGGKHPVCEVCSLDVTILVRKEAG